MVEVGDLVKCPKCNNYGRAVWVSKDGKTVGVRCSSRHRFTQRHTLILTPSKSENTRFERNMIFLVSKQ